MRIIAGRFKGKKLIAPTGSDVRPTTDMVKESIFGMIQFDVPDSVFVDLFSGSGAIGIEALSRGAREVIFADLSRQSINLIKQNLAGITCNNYKVIEAPYERVLSELSNQGKKVDIIFIDPPYKDKPLGNILELTDKYDILSDDGMVIYEHLYADKVEIEDEHFVIVKSKKYGTVGVEVIKKR